MKDQIKLSKFTWLSPGVIKPLLHIKPAAQSTSDPQTVSPSSSNSALLIP